MISGLENPLHGLVLLGIALLVLGPKRLPEVGRSLGRGLRELRHSISEGPDRDAPAEPSSLPAGDRAPSGAGA